MSLDLKIFITKIFLEFYPNDSEFIENILNININYQMFQNFLISFFNEYNNDLNSHENIFNKFYGIKEIIPKDNNKEKINFEFNKYNIDILFTLIKNYYNDKNFLYEKILNIFEINSFNFLTNLNNQNKSQYPVNIYEFLICLKIFNLLFNEEINIYIIGIFFIFKLNNNDKINNIQIKTDNKNIINDDDEEYIFYSDLFLLYLIIIYFYNEYNNIKSKKLILNINNDVNDKEIYDSFCYKIKNNYNSILEKYFEENINILYLMENTFKLKIKKLKLYINTNLKENDFNILIEFIKQSEIKYIKIYSLNNFINNNKNLLNSLNKIEYISFHLINNNSKEKTLVNFNTNNFDEKKSLIKKINIIGFNLNINEIPKFNNNIIEFKYIDKNNNNNISFNINYFENFLKLQKLILYNINFTQFKTLISFINEKKIFLYEFQTLIINKELKNKNDYFTIFEDLILNQNKLNKLYIKISNEEFNVNNNNNDFNFLPENCFYFINLAIKNLIHCKFFAITHHYKNYFDIKEKTKRKIFNTKDKNKNKIKEDKFFLDCSDVLTIDNSNDNNNNINNNMDIENNNDLDDIDNNIIKNTKIFINKKNEEISVIYNYNIKLSEYENTNNFNQKLFSINNNYINNLIYFDKKDYYKLFFVIKKKLTKLKSKPILMNLFKFLSIPLSKQFLMANYNN